MDRGSYDLRQSELFRAIGQAKNLESGNEEIHEKDLLLLEEQAVYDKPDTHDGITPTMYIGRAACTKDVTRYQWHDYIDDIGTNNIARGRSVGYGSLTVTYVDKQEMGRMLQEKFPDMYANKEYDRIHSYIKQLARSVNHYVSTQDSEVTAIQSALATTTSVCLERDSTNLLWTRALFDIDHQPSELTKRDLSYVFKKNDAEVMLHEMDGIWQFLKKYEKLPTNRINHQRRPHITLFNAFNPIYRTGLYHDSSVPESIMLKAPHAYDSRKKI